jgi:hypothetical protein
MSNETSLSKAILQHLATSDNRVRRIVAPKVAGAPGRSMTSCSWSSTLKPRWNDRLMSARNRPLEAHVSDAIAPQRDAEGKLGGFCTFEG